MARRRTKGDETPATSPATEAPATEAPGQCLTFTLAGEEYAAGILHIREIVEYEAVTRVPTTPPWIRGVMNLRGTVVPVVDLALKLGLAETRPTPRTCVVIVEVDLDEEPTLMGVMVDAVVRVIELSAEDVEEPPAFGTRVRVDYLLAAGKVDDQLVPVLDIDRVLSLDELLAVTRTGGLSQGQQEGLSQGQQEGLSQGQQEGLSQGQKADSGLEERERKGTDS